MRNRLVLAVVIVLGVAGGLAGQGLVAALETLLPLGGRPVPASSATLSEHELEAIDGMAPQDQAMRLLERTINHYWGAGEEIAKRSAGWMGQIHSTPELEKLTGVAYFSSDLRVRAAALEIWLTRDGLRKAPETVTQLIHAAAETTDRKWFYLSSLGILGNRGVERQQVFDTLMLYVNDPDASVRAAAINGLALLGTRDTIAPLLRIFHDDSSADLRERAACNLADSGMLSRDLRIEAVPELIRFSQDFNLEGNTRKWVFQALREITLQQIGDDPSGWLIWYEKQR
jgi:hypothetical protein